MCGGHGIRDSTHEFAGGSARPGASRRSVVRCGPGSTPTAVFSLYPSSPPTAQIGKTGRRHRLLRIAGSPSGILAGILPQFKHSAGSGSAFAGDRHANACKSASSRRLGCPETQGRPGSAFSSSSMTATIIGKYLSRAHSSLSRVTQSPSPSWRQVVQIICRTFC